MRRLRISVNRAQYIRTLVRAVAIAASAFGLRLSADQVVAVYGVTEAVLQLLVIEKPAA